MATAVVMVNFGEPSRPDREAVIDYLTRIFEANAALEGPAAGDPSTRARELAERRAPGLIEDYEAIGGSPLAAQARGQARLLEAELAVRGHDVETVVAMQFTDPDIETVVERLAADGVGQVVGLPMYPLCGPSTTVAALERLAAAIEGVDGWSPAVDELTGWHRHPTYARLRADRIRTYLDEHGLDPTAPDTDLVFSAHGTPTSYLEAGSRYVTYVEEYCEVVAAMLGVDDYRLGYQNHGNRDVAWTEPAVESLLDDVEADRIVVEPVSFVHEQSETLAELDRDLRDEAAAHDLGFHRVPIPHDDPRLAGLLADLLEPFLAGFEPGYVGLRRCVCRDRPGTVCLNAPLPSPRQ